MLVADGGRTMFAPTSWCIARANQASLREGGGPLAVEGAHVHENIYACVQTVCFSTVARAPSVGFAASSLPEGALLWLIGNFGRTQFAPTGWGVANFDLSLCSHQLFCEVFAPLFSKRGRGMGRRQRIACDSFCKPHSGLLADSPVCANFDLSGYLHFPL